MCDRFKDDLDAWNRCQEFVRDGSPASWLEYGEELRDSAEFLWQREPDGIRLEATLNAEQEVLNSRKASEISRVYMLLAGFALENLLKGLSVSLDATHINKGTLSKELKSHKLLTLVAKIPDLTLSPAEREFCANASDAIPYWGRYPIPLEKNKVMPSVAVTEELRQAFVGLFDRLAHLLYWAVRNGWDSGVGPKTLRVRSSRYGDKIDPREPIF